jgi:adenylate kinase family enzyme
MPAPTLNSDRIVVVGTSSIGKTSFAKRLATARALPRIELDALYWGCHWQPKPEQEFFRLLDEATITESWIADGNYGSIRDRLWPKATQIIWLNYSLTVNIWRGLKRSIVRAVCGEELWHGNRESFTRTFMSKESILVWIVTTHNRRRREFEELRSSDRFSKLSWLEFRRPQQAESWLRRIENAA